MDKISDISAVLIVKNEEEVLKDCLISLERFAEVVIYLNDSTDKSEEIARSFTNTKIVSGPFLEGFGATRNAAAAHARNDWIFGIDADERCSEQLLDSIASFDTQQNPPQVGRVVRANYFMGKQFESVVFARLYQRKHYHYEQLVHEDLVPSQRGGGIVQQVLLSGQLQHLLPDFTRLCEKARLYAKLAANSGKPRRSVVVSFILAGYKFILWYLLRGCVLRGKAGLLYACQAYYYAYTKYRIPRSTN